MGQLFFITKRDQGYQKTGQVLQTWIVIAKRALTTHCYFLRLFSFCIEFGHFVFKYLDLIVCEKKRMESSVQVFVTQLAFWVKLQFVQETSVKHDYSCNLIGCPSRHPWTSAIPWSNKFCVVPNYKWYSLP